MEGLPAMPVTTRSLVVRLTIFAALALVVSERAIASALHFVR